MRKKVLITNYITRHSQVQCNAYAVAKKRGYTVDKNDIDNKVASGPRKPSSGKTNRYILGTDKKQNLHVQVANLDNKRFELNMYIESVKKMRTWRRLQKNLKVHQRNILVSQRK